MLNGLDLFSGIGGLAVALAPWVRPISYCENDRYAQAVLLSRMRGGHLPIAPIWDDVQSLTARHFPYQPDIIYGGFPCQDISAAGLGAGLEGKRSGLYFELLRIVKECSPPFVYLENVPAIRTRGLKQVVGSLTAIGYDCRWTVVSAREVGAPHLRNRWFLLAHANRQGLWDWRERDTQGQTKANTESRDNGAPWPVADTTLERCQGRGSGSGTEETIEGSGLHTGGCSETLANANGTGLEYTGKVHAGSRSNSGWPGACGSGWWHVEPSVGRVADGVFRRVDKLRGLGNAVVPLQARTAFARLLGDSILNNPF